MAPPTLPNIQSAVRRLRQGRGPHLMLVTRRNPFTQELVSREINCTKEQLRKWQSGAGLVQDIFPHLDVWDREFIMTGITQEQWDRLFGVAEEETPDWLEPNYDDDCWTSTDSGVETA